VLVQARPAEGVEALTVERNASVYVLRDVTRQPSATVDETAAPEAQALGRPCEPGRPCAAWPKGAHAQSPWASSLRPSACLQQPRFRSRAAGRVSVYRRRIRLACVVLTDGMSPTQRPIGQQSPQSVATSSACEPHRCAPWRPAGGRDTRRSATKGVGWRLSGRSCATRSAANVPDMRLPGRRGSLHDAVGYAGATPGVSGTHVRRRGGSGGAAMQEGAPVSGGTGRRPGPTPAHRQRLRTTATAFVATCATVDSTRPTRSPRRGTVTRARPKQQAPPYCGPYQT
jgi:hypothetical protein